MPDSPLDLLAPSRLAGLLHVDPRAPWSKSDAAAALRHQLTASLLPDLALVPGIEIDRLRPLATPATTFLDLLSSPTPSLELLQALKLWTRHVRHAEGNPLAGTPATVLYFAALAAALVRLNQRITTLSDADLRAGIAWALPLADSPALTQLFTIALTLLPPPSPTPH